MNLEPFISKEYENIIGGDFNSFMDNRLDKLGGDPNSRQAATYFLRTFNERYDLCDIWRERHKDERNYTWTGRMTSNHLFIRTRIDFFLTSRALNQFITAVDIKPYAHSDHDCITLAIDFDKIHRGPGYWHFNNDLLTDAVFQTEIERFWTGWQEEFKNFSDPLKWWDKAKQNFKIIAIRQAKISGKLLRHERFQLENKLVHLQERAKNGTTQDIEQYLLTKEKLKQLDLKDLEATKIRAKAQFMEEGEKSTRYFFSLEKSRKANQTIRILTKDNLDTVTETRDLLSETRAFYKKLYSAETCDENAQETFLNATIPNLPEDARNSCEGELTEEELRKAVTAMELDKSPGIDGLTTNFYKHF